MNPSFISHFLSRIWKKIRSFFFLDQWIVFVAPSSGYHALAWENFKPLIPPMDRFWADPFIWVRENGYYLFIEELLYSTHRGRIACLTLDKNLDVTSNQVVLEQPYHLSYPFLFEHAGQLYMIPETGKNNRVELYRCIHFPNQWEFEKTLISNICALDTTLLEAHGRWWLFANIQEKGGSSWDTLHLYYSDHPLSDHWMPHPLNPIVRDLHSARPAGRIFSDNGRLIRPSQDCSIRYGYAINFNQIVKLTETDYVETCEQTFKPMRKSPIQATHTYNDMAGVMVIDAIRRRRKL